MRRRTHKTATGLVVRSKFERDVCEWLDKKGVVYAYEAITLPWSEKIKARCGTCASTVIYKDRTYTPDIRLHINSFWEIKGKFDAHDRKLLLGVRTRHPHVVVRLLFQRNNKISPKSKTRYLDWARDNDFEAAIWPSVPKHWYTKPMELTDVAD